MASVGLYGYHGSTVWFDELFLGRDDAAKFRCPTVSEATKASVLGANTAPEYGGDSFGLYGGEEPLPPGAGVEMRRPEQTGWRERDLGQETTFWEQTRHVETRPSPSLPRPLSLLREATRARLPRPK